MTFKYKWIKTNIASTKLSKDKRLLKFTIPFALLDKKPNINRSYDVSILNEENTIFLIHPSTIFPSKTKKSEEKIIDKILSYFA